MDLSRLFIHNLKKWRKVSGMSQKRLAEKCGTGCSYIRQMESGVGYPSFAMIAKIAEALKIEPYQLLYDDASTLSRAAHERHLESAKGRLIDVISNDIQLAFDELKSANTAPPRDCDAQSQPCPKPAPPDQTAVS